LEYTKKKPEKGKRLQPKPGGDPGEFKKEEARLL